MQPVSFAVGYEGKRAANNPPVNIAVLLLSWKKFILNMSRCDKPHVAE